MLGDFSDGVNGSDDQIREQHPKQQAA